MRIISKFHDYYDGVTCGIHDPGIVWERNRQEKYVQTVPFAPAPFYSACYDHQYLLFCGKFYHRLLEYSGAHGVAGHPWNKIHRKSNARWRLYIRSIEDEFESQYGLEKWNDFCVEQKTPTILFTHCDREYFMVLNPSLKDLEFFRVYDAYTCYQQLEQWVDNHLVHAQRPQVTLSDEMKIAKHGFDKYSFRKEKVTR